MESMVTRRDVTKMILISVKSLQCLVHEDKEEEKVSAIQLNRAAASYWRQPSVDTAVGCLGLTSRQMPYPGS
jgi:hypothetical protein